MCRESQIFLVTPKHAWLCTHRSLDQHVVKVDNLISGIVSHEHYAGALIQFDTILNQRENTLIDSLLWHLCVVGMCVLIWGLAVENALQRTCPVGVCMWARGRASLCDERLEISICHFIPLFAVGRSGWVSTDTRNM